MAAAIHAHYKAGKTNSNRNVVKSNDNPKSNDAFTVTTLNPTK